jgi:hypothetical protein
MVQSTLLCLCALLATAQLTLVAGDKLKAGQAAAKYDTNVFGGDNASILTYPGDWSRNAYTLPVHSHND